MDYAHSSKDATTAVSPLGIVDRVYMRLVGLFLRRTELWEDIRRFASWLEFDAAGLAGQTHESTILVELDSGRPGPTVRIGASKHHDLLNDYQQLWDLFASLGIKHVELDSRLESNQIKDVITVLYAHRRRLSKPDENETPTGVVGSLLGEKGLHMACTCVSIRGQRLVVSYTHCTLAFSRFMRWFEQRQRNFHDHRALFHAAPRYAALVWIVSIGPSIIYAHACGDWIQFTMSAFAAFLLAGLVYMFFMVAGSVEYENEEKDYQLTKAYYGMKTYAQHIKADLRDAQEIQHKFLPDLTDDRLSEHIDWVASFDPAEEVGGDYYDVQVLDDNKIAILFGDVSGHGLAAAFITGILKTTFASWPESQITLTEFMRLLNSTLHRLIPVGSFAAVFVGVYDRSTGELSYVNGGHYPQPLHMPAAGEEPISSIAGGGTLLMGVDQNIRIEPSRLSLKPGDVILFVSDAVVDNRNIEGELYGADRLGDLLQARRGGSLQDLAESIVNEGRFFSRETEQTDDTTILALQIKKGRKEGTTEFHTSGAHCTDAHRHG